MSTNVPQRLFRTTIVFAIWALSASSAIGQILSQGPLSPATVVNDAAIGTAIWVNPLNAIASDDSYATTAPGGIPSQFLKATTFGFSIPSVAQITGIEATVERRSALGTVVDAAVRIVKGGVVGAADRTAVGFWPTTDGTVTYGSDSDLWGETWTPADINAAGFGFAISATDSFDTAGVDHIQVTVYYTLCGDAPAAGCRPAGKSVLVINDKAQDSKDKIVWKWIRGQSTTTADFADPVGSAVYSLCVYAGPTNALVGDSVVPPSSSRWQPISTKGFRYKDPLGSEGGIQKITLKASIADKAKATVKGKGVALPDYNPPLGNPVTVQLVNSDTGVCWESTFGPASVKRNQAGKFKAVNAP